MSKNSALNPYLPTGHHWGLVIEHRILEDSGSFVEAEPKTVWHTTEGNGIEGAYATLKANRDAPNVIIDPASGHVIQTISLAKSARALEHPAGTVETNRAGCRQIEVVGFTHECHGWPISYYRHLAALAVLIEHRTHTKRVAHVSFDHPQHIADQNFAATPGHIGHVHVPNNSHVDPTGFRIALLFDLMRDAEHTYSH